MAKTVLGNLLQANLSGQKDSSVCHLGIVRALSTYISGQVSMVGTFVGTLIAFPNTPGSFPSTNKIDASLLATQVISCAPDPSGNGGPAQWMSWAMSLYTAIKTCCFISLGPSVPTGMLPAFSMLTVPSWSQSSLGSVGNSSDPFGDAMDIMAIGIKTDLMAGFTPVFPSLYGGTYTGATTVTSIICP